MCLYNLIMDHDAPILPILFTQFRTSFSRTSAREHRSALSFHLSMSWRPSPSAVPYVQYKGAVLPFLCGPGVRLARSVKRTDTRSAHFSLCFSSFSLLLLCPQRFLIGQTAA